MLKESFSSKDTYLIGKEIGQSVMPSTVITLIGDLGVGKTVFAQGLADGLGITESVNSPTFTILQIYEEGRLPLYHFDVYRIEDPDEMYEVGLDEYLYGEGVCLIEWADMISDMLPDKHMRVVIEKDLSKGFDYRGIRIDEDFSY